MKIKKVQLTEKDKLRAYKSAVRNAEKIMGTDKITLSKIYKNKKKYTRKGKNQVIREEERRES